MNLEKKFKFRCFMINICNSILILYEETLKLLVHFEPQLWNCFRQQGNVRVN